MRPLNKRMFTAHKPQYKPYGSAKNDLMQAIGSYCSYCERHSYSCGIDVEHIRHKSQNANRVYLWSNFLLACKNCNSVKGVSGVNSMYFPTVSDTFSILSYCWDGSVDINRAVLICPKAQEKAHLLIRLVGLDRRPGHPNYSFKDKRWSDRRAIWALAERYLSPWRAGAIEAQVIADLAKLSGGWSIWMTVFNSESAVLEKLNSEFPSTRVKKFHPNLKTMAASAATQAPSTLKTALTPPAPVGQ